jgi:hypothetical protein
MKEVKAWAREKQKKFARLLRKACKKMTEDERAVVMALLGLESCAEHLLASDMKARWEAAKILVERMLSHRTGASSKMQYYLVTLCEEQGNVSDRAPLVPLKDLKDKVYRSLKSLGLNAIGFIEVHALMNHPGNGEGRTLLFHVHLIAWTSRPFDPEAAARTLVNSGAWKNSLGADPVNFKKVGDRPEDLAAVSHYVLKPQHSAKNRMESSKTPGKFLLMDTEKGYRPELAMRLTEGQSQVELLDTIFGVLDGTKVRQGLRAELMKWHRQRIKGGVKVDSAFDIWRWWYDYRKSNGSQNYLPYRFFGCGGIMPRPSKIRVRKFQPKAFRGRRTRRYTPVPKKPKVTMFD